MKKPHTRQSDLINTLDALGLPGTVFA